MAILFVYPYGEEIATVPSGQKVQIYSIDTLDLYQQVGVPNQPVVYKWIYSTSPGETYTSAAFSANTIIRIVAHAAVGSYSIAVSPSITTPLAGITASATPFDITGVTDAQGGAVRIFGGNSTTPNNVGGGVTVTAGTGAGTGVGGTVNIFGGTGGPSSNGAGAAQLIGGAGSGTATAGGGNANLVGGNGGGLGGAGGSTNIVAGNAIAGNSNGGDVTLTPGAGFGSGLPGNVYVQGAFLEQTTVAAKTVSALLTAAELKGRLITVNQGAGAASAQQLPTAANLDAALAGVNNAETLFFSVINTSVVAAESASVTTNTGWTLVGPMDVPAYSAAGSLNSAALFGARKTGPAAWTLYRAG